MTDDALTFLGRTNWRGQSRVFGIRQQDRRSHLYVVGKTGTGKSSLLEMMTRQDVIAGNGFALFDPHGDLAERLYAWIPESKRANVVLKRLCASAAGSTSTGGCLPITSSS